MASLIPATTSALLPTCESSSSSRKISTSPSSSCSRTHFLVGTSDVSQPRRSSFLIGGDSSSSLQGFWWPLVCAAQRPARDSAIPFALRIVDSSQKNQLVTGFKGEPKVLQSRTSTSWDAPKALAVTEGLCIVVAAASYTTSVLKKHQQGSTVDSSSSVTSKVLSKIGGLSTWYVPALWVALVINAVLRWVQRKKPKSKWGERSVRDFTVDQRVGKLEEDVHDLTISAQMLAKHLEKLGVRFRATRRTMRDPIQETVELLHTTSKIVTTLAKREENLERELQQTQRSISAMQEQQVKQLELLRAGITKNLRSQRIFEERISKKLSQRLSEAPQNLTGAAPITNEDSPPKSRRQTVMKGLGSFWRGLVTNEETSTSASVPSSPLEKEKVATPAESSEAPDLLGKGRLDHDEGEKNAVGVPSNSKSPQSDKPVYYPDTSFSSKDDFWATPTTTESPGEEAPSRMNTTAEAERTTDARLQYSANNESRGGATGRLDSFFSSRKGDLRSQSGDLDNSSGVKQSYPNTGDHYSNGSSMW